MLYTRTVKKEKNPFLFLSPFPPYLARVHRSTLQFPYNLSFLMFSLTPKLPCLPLKLPYFIVPLSRINCFLEFTGCFVSKREYHS
jgi:hypothetical protein